MSQDFESFNDKDDEWLSELETRAIDLEKELFDWRESRAREVTESVYGRESVPDQARSALGSASGRRTYQGPH
jgi:hypothetical protein